MSQLYPNSVVGAAILFLTLHSAAAVIEEFTTADSAAEVSMVLATDSAFVADFTAMPAQTIDCDPNNPNPPVDPTPVDPVPPISPVPPGGQIGSGVPAGWNLVFDENFDGTGDLDVTSEDRNWRFETMSDGLHRAGNSGINERGDVVQHWASPRGKRWSAWYNGFHDANAYREDGNLIMGGVVTNEPDPTRPIDYFDRGVLTQYGSGKLYTSWIDTFARKWVGPGGRHIVDPASPGKAWRYGYFEVRVNFSEMITPGFRLSTWLMPASRDAASENLVIDRAYDADGNNGVEIDLFEYENASARAGGLINLALQGGAAGHDAMIYDAAAAGVNLREGYHNIGILWPQDSLAWYLNGVEIKVITDPDLIPDVYSYLIISREMNSGVKNPNIEPTESSDVLQALPFRPRDPGLFGLTGR